MNCCICFFRCCVASSCCSVGCPFSSTYYAWLQKRNVWKYEKKEKWWNCEHCYCCCWFCVVGFFAPCILDEVVSFRHVWHRHQSLDIYQEQKHFREMDLSEICGYLVLTIAIFPSFRTTFQRTFSRIFRWSCVLEIHPIVIWDLFPLKWVREYVRCHIDHWSFSQYVMITLWN